MKHSLPRFSSVALIVGIAMGCNSAPAADPRAPAPSSAIAPSAASTAGSSEHPAGQLLVANAQRVLGQHVSIEASLRQDVDLFGHQLLGKGSLKQLNSQGQALIRLELRIQVQGQISSLLQVSDGRYLWTDRQLGDERTVRRLDTSLLHGAGQGDLAPPNSVMSDPALALGGLGGLLAGLAANFDFSTTGAQVLADVPVYVLVGRWKLERLGKLLPGQQQAIKSGQPLKLNKLPEYVPHEVHLLLGRDDLFPYVVDFRGTRGRLAGKDKEPSTANVELHSLVKMQWYEVRINGPVESQQFVYNPGDAIYEDQTDEFVKNFRARVAH